MVYPLRSNQWPTINLIPRISLITAESPTLRSASPLATCAGHSVPDQITLPGLSADIASITVVLCPMASFPAIGAGLLCHFFNLGYNSAENIIVETRKTEVTATQDIDGINQADNEAARAPSPTNRNQNTDNCIIRSSVPINPNASNK